MVSMSVVLTLLLGVVGAVKVKQAPMMPFALPMQMPTAPPTPTDAWSFLSNDLRQCVEGAPEMVESSLALRKAGITGALYNNTFAAEGGCQARGYTPAVGIRQFLDDCHPNVTAFFLTEADQTTFKQATEDAINEYAKRWGLDSMQAHKMHGCTCHPESFNHDLVDMECPDVLNGISGSWIHHDPKDQSELMCDGGRFLEATLSLAVLKSTGQLMMHEHDQIAPVTCEQLGFTREMPDHCFAGLHVGYKTDPIMEDPGIKQSMAVEQMVFSKNLSETGGSFDRFVLDHHLNNKVLNGRFGCHCSPDSEVFGQMFSNQKYDEACLHHTSPIRLWWKDTTF
jgi:hypothetical protein